MVLAVLWASAVSGPLMCPRTVYVAPLLTHGSADVFVLAIWKATGSSLIVTAAAELAPVASSAQAQARLTSAVPSTRRGRLLERGTVGSSGTVISRLMCAPLASTAFLGWAEDKHRHADRGCQRCESPNRATQPGRPQPSRPRDTPGGWGPHLQSSDSPG